MGIITLRESNSFTPFYAALYLKLPHYVKSNA